MLPAVKKCWQFNSVERDVFKFRRTLFSNSIEECMKSLHLNIEWFVRKEKRECWHYYVLFPRNYTVKKSVLSLKKLPKEKYFPACIYQSPLHADVIWSPL